MAMEQRDLHLYPDLLSMEQLLVMGCACSPDDPEFESACCGSPEQPVDLSALDGMALDFPLNVSVSVTANEVHHDDHERNNNAPVEAWKKKEREYFAGPSRGPSEDEAPCSKRRRTVTPAASGADGAAASTSRRPAMTLNGRRDNEATAEDDDEDAAHVRLLVVAASASLGHDSDDCCACCCASQASAASAKRVEFPCLGCCGRGPAATRGHEASSSGCRPTSRGAPTDENGINQSIDYSAKEMAAAQSDREPPAAYYQLQTATAAADRKERQREMNLSSSCSPRAANHNSNALSYEGGKASAEYSSGPTDIQRLIGSLLPVPASTCAAVDLEAGHWFRCQLCHTLQETARLLQHVAEQHQHLMTESDPARAAACCISRADDDEDVLLRLGAAADPRAHGLLHEDDALSSLAGRATSAIVEASTPDELAASFNHFDSDLDDVVDEKFIDSLIRTMPSSSASASASALSGAGGVDAPSASVTMTTLIKSEGSGRLLPRASSSGLSLLFPCPSTSSSSCSSSPSASSSASSSCSSAPGLAFSGVSPVISPSNGMQSNIGKVLLPSPGCYPVQHQPQPGQPPQQPPQPGVTLPLIRDKKKSPACLIDGNSVSPSGVGAQAPCYGSPVVSVGLCAPFPSPPSSKSPQTASGPASVATPTSSSSAQGASTPQFRWRRRKRRSKAQYPEMGRFLLPVDSGDEVQHLGRTLECQLCGLRGKRCHLTLHFKAKHSEVIEMGLHNRQKQLLQQAKTAKTAAADQQPKAAKAVNAANAAKSNPASRPAKGKRGMITCGFGI